MGATNGTNWNVELKKLEREFGGLPPEPTQAELNARRASERRARELKDAINARIGAAIRCVLVLALAVALYYWPYARSCGAGLLLYIGAQVVFAAGALWVTAYTWRHRLTKTHALAIAMFVGALGMLSAQVLPRVAWGRVAPAYQARWSCG